jgi:hypothetical protein
VAGHPGGDRPFLEGHHDLFPSQPRLRHQIRQNWHKSGKKRSAQPDSYTGSQEKHRPG